MNKNTVEIKEQRKDAFVKEIFLLVMLVVSLTTALLPFLSATAQKTPGPFFLIGGTAFVIFTSLFVLFIYKDFNPKTVMILSPSGFIDIRNVGDDIEIEWSNVSSVKLLGKGSTPFIGISLENTDIIAEKMKRNEAEIMRENIEDGLPAILISQNDVKTPIKQLKDLIVNYVKESRTLHNDTPKKEKKLNPFTTTAVLRAFGHTTETEDNSDTIVAEDNKEATVATKDDSFYSTLQSTSEEDNSVPTEQANDSEDNLAETSSELEDMPDEIKELLNRAKSSKISELGKILSEKDVPYSMIREDAKAETITDVIEVAEEATEINEEEQEEHIESPDILEQIHLLDTDMAHIDEDGEISTHKEMTDFVTYVQNDTSSEASENVSDNSFETNLDSMLQTAFDNTRQEIEREEKSVKDSKVTTDFDSGFFPELVLFNDIELDEMPEEFNANQKYNNNEVADFITSIEDD